jgi:hypothetical protein
MTLFALMECCELLAIDPKTLQHWRKQAGMSLQLHPDDERRKCLTREQLQQLALLHSRVLRLEEAPPITSVGSLASADQQEPTPPEGTHAATSLATMSPPPQQSVDLVQKLSCLEAKVATLQELVAQLALEVAQERRLHREGSPQASLPQQPDAEHLVVQGRATPEELPHQGRSLHPAELRARARVLPLVEYSAQGTYVVICPQAGELPLLPDSAEWFDWLARLSAFRFVGKEGYFTAYRKGTQRKPSRTWSTQLYFHQHTYRSYLGVTDHLTIAVLERAAAQLQSALR